MDRFTVIKNGLVLTLDRKGSSGYFNILIKNGKIFIIDIEKKFNEKEFLNKYPEAVIIDAENKIIMPGFFNSRLISSFGLNKVFLKKCSYENINSWLSLKSIEKFLSSDENSGLFLDLMKISFQRSLRNGELFICENNSSVKNEFLKKYLIDNDWIKQHHNFIIYDYSVFQENITDEKFLSLGFKADEEITNYSLTSMKKSLSGRKMKLFIEASLPAKTFDALKNDFGKSYINVLSDLELLSPLTVIVNPVKINFNEIELLKKKNTSILICPSDFINLSDKKTDIEELFFSGLNIIVGTGYTGTSILAELKILSGLINKNILKHESLLKTSVYNPALIFGISNVTGSIERNKSADLIFFSIEDIRSRLSLPEIDSELLCEFIIQNLSVKDISDVILKGEVIVSNGKDVTGTEDILKSKIKNISDRIYSEGKYFEFKEKYLMRGRVDKINLDNEEEQEKKAEVFVDYTDTTEIYLGEGEFTIIGKKEEDFEKERDEDKTDEVNLKEIKSLESELNLLDDITEQQDISEPVTKKKKKIQETVYPENEIKIKEIPESEKITFPDEIEAKNIIDSTEIKKSELETDEIQKEKSEIKKARLKFGFGEEGKN